MIIKGIKLPSIPEIEQKLNDQGLSIDKLDQVQVTLRNKENEEWDELWEFEEYRYYLLYSKHFEEKIVKLLFYANTDDKDLIGKTFKIQ